MAHGMRDWSNLGAEENVYSMMDMAELAARLGSPSLFNREGNVLFIDTFEHGLKPWNLVGSGTNADAIASHTWSRYGGYSMKLITGYELGGGMIGQRSFPYPVLSRYGIEYAFSIEPGITQIDTVISHRDGAEIHSYAFRMQLDANRLIIWHADYVPVIFKTSLTLATTSYSYHVVKIVIDIVNNMWLRIILNDTEYDLSAYSGSSVDYPATPLMDVQITAFSGADSNAAVYLDDFIITFNEP